MQSISSNWPGWNNQVVRGSQAQCLEKMATRDAFSAAINRLEIVRSCNGLFQPVIIAAVWQWLPMHYKRELDGDHWQTAEETLIVQSGDCEDWAILLSAVLKRLGVDARIGVMPGHAAVFVPVRNVAPFSILFGQIDARTLLPANWPLLNYAGGRWLALEATVPPAIKGLPGEHLNLIAPAANQGTLVIAAP